MITHKIAVNGSTIREYARPGFIMNANDLHFIGKYRRCQHYYPNFDKARVSTDKSHARCVDFGWLFLDIVQQ